MSLGEYWYVTSIYAGYNNRQFRDLIGERWGAGSGQFRNLRDTLRHRHHPGSHVPSPRPSIKINYEHWRNRRGAFFRLPRVYLQGLWPELRQYCIYDRNNRYFAYPYFSDCWWILPDFQAVLLVMHGASLSHDSLHLYASEASSI